MLANPSPAVSLFIACILVSWLHAKVPILTNQVPMQLLKDTTICRITSGLTKSQLELCYQQPDTTEIALEGIQQAVQECQHQFHNHRWNCSSLSTKSKNPYTNAIFHKGYRETAFAYAISSAGVTVSVAKACSYGKLLNCGCDPHSYRIRNKRSPSKFKWGGCSHNVQFGMRFSRKFLDSREKATDIHSKINLHNNHVGRLAVAKNMQIKCKCHGMSGNCELKTCWRATPDFRHIGRVLKENFRTAVLVDQSNLGNRRKRNRNRDRATKKPRKKPKSRVKEWTPHKTKYKKMDLAYNLLYYQKSPTFCEPMTNIDVPGTFGRECNRTTLGPNSCSSLCCGRGYNLERRRRIERCNCKFIWCCSVECQTCSVEEWISVCN